MGHILVAEEIGWSHRCFRAHGLIWRSSSVKLFRYVSWLLLISSDVYSKRVRMNLWVLVADCDVIDVKEITLYDTNMRIRTLCQGRLEQGSALGWCHVTAGCPLEHAGCGAASCFGDVCHCQCSPDILMLRVFAHTTMVSVARPSLSSAVEADDQGARSFR